MSNKQLKWFSLDVVLNRVQEIFDSSISGNSFWLKVEIAQLKKDRRGHYYLELVENKNGFTLAKARGTIWRTTAFEIESNLGEKKDHILKEGAEILCFAQIIFSPVYGLSINILDIDLSFSLGEVERKKQQALMSLQEKGLLDLNKQVPLVSVIQNIAVIAAVNTAGYMDFIQQLKANEYGFVFTVDSYDAKVQGDQAHIGIMNQLREIQHKSYDVVVILRGGGAAMDLDVFNNLALASSIASYTLPIFTAIGHQTDTSVVDFVANTSFKTPSAAGAFIVDRAFNFWITQKEMFFKIKELVALLLEQGSAELSQNILEVKNQSNWIIRQKGSQLDTKASTLALLVKDPINAQNTTLYKNTTMLKTLVKSVSFEKLQDLANRASSVRLLSSNLHSASKYQLSNQQELLVIYLSSMLKKENAVQKQRLDVLQAYNIEGILRKGFAIVRVNDTVINQHTLLEPLDVLQIQLLNKAYLITIKDIKETQLWNSLLTKAPHKN